MKYQLVIQWPATSMKDYDALIEIEEVLIEKLSKMHEVDGHDIGAKEFNIFIQTDNPQSASNEVKTILSDSVYSDARAAYREISKSEYKILWPKSLTKFSID